MLALLVATLAAAEPNPYLPKALEQIRALDEASALQTLQQAQAWPDNSSHDLARVYLYLGLAHAGLAHQAEAVTNFKTALSADRSLQLPDGSSPRVKEWWVKAGGTLPEAPSLKDLKQPSFPEPQPVGPIAITVPSPAPPPASSTRWPLVVVGLVASLGGATTVSVGGLYFGLRAQSLSEESQRATRASDKTSAYEAALSNAQMANRLWVPGAVLLLAGVVLLVAGLISG